VASANKLREACGILQEGDEGIFDSNAHCLIPPHPAHELSCGRGVEALVLAILDGHHALYKVGRRLEERGMVALLQPGLTRASLNDYLWVPNI
jgi:hypothetical protein